jgi:hypothetical protein
VKVDVDAADASATLVSNDGADALSLAAAR